MNKIIFTEEFCQPENLYPFTLTRQIQDIRVGILTIREKWERMLGMSSYDRKEDDYKDLDRSIHLSDIADDDTCFMIHGNVLPTPQLIRTIKQLKNGEFISAKGTTGIVFRFTKKEITGKHKVKVTKSVDFDGEVKTIHYPWDIFHLNDWAIRHDFLLLKGKRKSQRISKTNKVSSPLQVFIEKGAKVEHAIINASTGPVYIGAGAEVMDGCLIRGPFALGENACLKMGSKIYGAVSLGPSSVCGGEIKNSVVFGFSNKAHDGYLGDSIIGEWCNLGAGTTNSNMKNNASDVRVWTPKGELNVGRKCGVMMGDYTHTSINTSINTGTVIGVCANVFGAGLTPKYIPSFAWGSDGVNRYDFEKALLDIEDWKKMKGKSLEQNEKKILKHIFQNF
ncbi:MAG: glucose-1-phosphate thymidylyltransferase [Bacteroidetes bacterium]|nr:MAG: glucose-1-phosphate thymidylyltransferase [Bacteroidota bacterium]